MFKSLPFLFFVFVLSLPVLVFAVNDSSSYVNATSLNASTKTPVLVNSTTLSLNIPVDGGLILVFHGATNITARLGLSRLNANYTLIIGGGNVTFTATTVGPYTLVINVSYPILSWYNVSIKIFDTHNIIGYETMLRYYTSNITIEVNVNVVSLPDYPSAEDIVRANYNATIVFIKNIIDTIIQESLETRSELKRLEKVTDKLPLKLQGSLRELSSALKEFRSNVDRVNELSFTVIAVYTITSVFAITVLVICAKYLVFGYG